MAVGDGEEAATGQGQAVPWVPLQPGCGAEPLHPSTWAPAHRAGWGGQLPPRTGRAVG